MDLIFESLFFFNDTLNSSLIKIQNKEDSTKEIDIVNFFSNL